MPSSKNPGTTVQPGPGNLPDSTVSATALDFNPMGGTNAALQAHITDPIDAHEASAIGTPGFGGVNRWAVPSSASVQSALTATFDGLNARSALVLDSNPAATDADYFGPNALTNAYSLLGANNKYTLYLRPGTYNWTDGAVLNGVTIVGGGAPSTDLGATEVVIQNTGGNIRLGTGVTIHKCKLSCFGSLQIQGDGSGRGHNTLENCSFQVTGFVVLSSRSNAIRQCYTHFSSAVPTRLSDSAGDNTYDTLTVNQLDVSSIGGSSFTNIVVGDGLDGANAYVSIASPNNRFTDLSILGSNGTNSALSIDGNGNSLSGVLIQGCTLTGSANAVALTGAGTRNALFNLQIVSCTVAASVVRMFAEANLVKSVRVQSCVISGSNRVFELQGSHCTIEEVTVSGVTGSVLQTIVINGTGSRIAGLVIQSPVTGSYVAFGPASASNVLDGCSVSALDSSTTSIVDLQGSNNYVKNVELSSLLSVAVPAVRFDTAASCVVDGITLTDVTADAGIGFQLVRMETSTDCVVRNVLVTACPQWGTTSGLINLIDCRKCRISGVGFNGVGSVNAVNSPLLTTPGTANTDCEISDIDIAPGNYVTAPSTRIFDLADLNMWRGLVISRCRVVTAHSTGRIVYAQGFFSTNPVLIKECHFEQESIISGHVIELDQAWNIQIENCHVISGNTDQTATALTSSNSTRASVLGCTFEGQQAMEAAFGLTVHNCRFIGADSVSALPSPTSAQLISVSGEDCVFSNCQVLVGTSNVQSTGVTTKPIVLFADCTVAGFRLAPTPAQALSVWHVGDTVVIVGSGNYSDLNLNLSDEGWAASGAGCSFSSFNLDGLGTNSAVLEVLSYNGGDTFDRPQIRNVSVSGLSAYGGGGRHIVKASGADIDGLTMDGAANAGLIGTSYTAPSITLKYCTLSNLRMWTVAPLQIGASNAYVSAITSVIRTAIVNRLTVAAGTAIAGSLFSLAGDSGSNGGMSTLQDSHIDLSSSPCRLTTLITVADLCLVENNRVVVQESTNPFSELINITGFGSKIVGNTVSYNRNTATVPFIRIGTNGSATVFGSVVSNNVLFANVAALNVQMIAADADRNVVSDNYLSNTAINSACHVSILGSYNNVCRNQIQFSWNTGSPTDSIVIGDQFNNVDGNFIVNASAAGGFARIGTTANGHYCRITNNSLVCRNSGSSSATINTNHGGGTSGNNVITGNHLENTDGGQSGSIVSVASDKPNGTATIADCNQLT